MDEGVVNALEFERRLSKAEVMMATLDERTRSQAASLKRIEDSSVRIEERLTTASQSQIRMLGAAVVAAVGSGGTLLFLVLSHLLK